MARRFRRRSLGVALLTLLAHAVFAAAALASAPSGGSVDRLQSRLATGPAVPGEIIVGFEEGVSEAEQNRVLARLGAVKKDHFKKIRGVLARVEPDKVKAAIKELEGDPQVRYAEPNFLLFADDHSGSPNDPAFHELWGLNNSGQTVNGTSGVADADIDATEAWGVTTGSASVVVAVIDTGVDFGHPDLGGNRWINAGDPIDGADNDGNGYVDDCCGWDFVSNDNNPLDDNGHGTHVAGTIGAIGNNGVGVVGVNWTVKIMALKFLSAAGSGTTANAVKAVLYASAMRARVLNNSWGGGGFSQALLDAIRQADASGSLFVAAAGNNSLDTDANASYPSGYDVPNVISVAATDSSDAKASFSNYGQRTVDLGAPGTNIHSTWPGNSYRYASGTSMATPHVAGAAALATAAFPGASDLGLKALLLRTVEPNASLSGRSVTGGRLNVDRAVRCSSTPKVWIEAPAAGFGVNVGEAVSVKVIGASCANAGGVAVSATANGSPIALTARGDGLYEGAYTPTAAGPVTISASATVGGATDTRTVSGSAVQNYQCGAAPLAWIDATAGGTKTVITGDDVSAGVSPPFNFTLYGQAFTSLQISSNGYVVFGPSAATAYANAAIPSTTAPNGLVAPFWDDLNPAAGGSVWYRTTGVAPNRRFVVEWFGVPHYSNVGNATIEVVLEEGTNDILFQYLDVTFGNASYDDGASATIGVENLDGAIGKQFSHNQAALGPYENLKAIRCTTAAPAPAGPAITTTSLADGTTGQPYSQTLQATGGTAPYAWSISAGSLPSGLTLNASTGAITGTPTTAGTFTFTARVTDSATTSASSTKTLSIVVGTPVAITTTSLPSGTAGTSYSQTLQASGGTPPYTWSIASGALPPGLSLNGATGQISGTPTTAGSFGFTVQVTDSAAPSRTATRPLSLTIAATPSSLAITTKGLPKGTVGKPYSQTLQASGGTTPYTWSIASGALPPGLTLNASTGTIAGTPTSAGTYGFTVRVTDSGTPAQTATKALSIKITALAVKTGSLPNGTVGTPYSRTLQASGGTTPYTWGIASGALPPGLSLSASGTISGTPTSAGPYNFTVRVTDSGTPTQTATKALSLTIAAP